MKSFGMKRNFVRGCERRLPWPGFGSCEGERRNGEMCTSCGCGGLEEGGRNEKWLVLCAFGFCFFCRKKNGHVGAGGVVNKAEDSSSEQDIVQGGVVCLIEIGVILAQNMAPKMSRCDKAEDSSSEQNIAHGYEWCGVCVVDLPYLTPRLLHLLQNQVEMSVKRLHPRHQLLVVSATYQYLKRGVCVCGKRGNALT